MMFEAIEVISKLFTGQVVRHDGKYFTLERAKLYTRPPDDQRVPIYVATAGPVNAKKTGKFADGLITVGAADEKMQMIWGKFEEGRAEAGKDPKAGPKMLQIHISWARTEDEAMQNALVEWPNGGMAFFPKQDIKNPEDFAGIAKLVRPEDFKNRVMISSDLEAHREAHPALCRHGLRRDPPAQCRAQPGGVHRGVRQGGPAESASAASERRPSRPTAARGRRSRPTGSRQEERATADRRE